MTGGGRAEGYYFNTQKLKGKERKLLKIIHSIQRQPNSPRGGGGMGLPKRESRDKTQCL